MNDDDPSIQGIQGLPLRRAMPTEADRRAAYKRLYVSRMVEAHGIDEADACECFEAGSDELDYNVHPEDAADDEVAGWDPEECL